MVNPDSTPINPDEPDRPGLREGQQEPIVRRSRCGAWAAEVDGRIGELRGRVKAVRGGRHSDESAGVDAVLRAVEADLDRADDAIGNSASLHRVWLRFCAWWSGSAITTAWEAVHAAELALLSVESDDEVAVNIPRLLSWVERTMDAGPQREAHEKTLREAMTEFKTAHRTKVRAALADTIEANGDRYANVRAFRNNLILVTFALLAAVIGAAIWHGANTHFLSLCTETTREGALTHCLGGASSRPHGVDVALVAAMGALGGLLAIAFSLSETDVAPTRYDPKTWQTVLKPVTGAAVAIIAVLFLQSGFLLKPSTETQSMFLAYAVLFGFSQQLLTRFVDKRADSLITPDGKS
jgi:hypothetical protein